MDTQSIKPKTTPKDFFLYIGVMVLLYGSVFALVNLLFSYIDYTFPDQLNNYFDPFSGTMRLAMAFLIILFPTFLVGTWFINKDLRNNPDKESIGVRKWLTFLALFVAGAGLLIDLSILVYTFLGGEVTMRFALKTLVIIVIAGYALAYYILDLRGRIRENRMLAKIFGGVALALVLGSIIASFFIVGTPAAQRDLRFDYQRINDLQNIQSQIVNHWTRDGSMPKSLEDLQDSISGEIVPVDPENGESYKYTLLKDNRFTLCATFARENDREPYDNYSIRTPTGEKMVEGSWKHKAGEQCFDRFVDPKRYPVDPTRGGILKATPIF